MKIGVFDSGIGGTSIANRLSELIPDAEIVSVNDHDHVPYGTRPATEIIELTDTAIQPLLDVQCDAIVIACNTATTVAIDRLREKYPTQKFVGIEPMIKPAAQLTHTKTIAVFATPGTLKSASYARLKKTWAQDITVLEPDCHDWASLIENGQSENVPIESTIKGVVEQNADVIVLACTHYHWLKDRAVAAAGPTIPVLEPSDAIARRITDITKES